MSPEIGLTYTSYLNNSLNYPSDHSNYGLDSELAASEGDLHSDLHTELLTSSAHLLTGTDMDDMEELSQEIEKER